MEQSTLLKDEIGSETSSRHFQLALFLVIRAKRVRVDKVIDEVGGKFLEMNKIRPDQNFWTQIRMRGKIRKFLLLDEMCCEFYFKNHERKKVVCERGHRELLYKHQLLVRLQDCAGDHAGGDQPGGT